MSVWIADNAPSSRWPLYTRGNVGEVFPEVVHPLNWLLYGVEAEKGWRDAWTDFGMVAPGDFVDDEPMTVLGVFGGYCYINASYSRVFGVRTPGSSPDAIDEQFLGESDAPPYVSRDGDKNAMASARIARTVARALFAKSLPGLDADKAAVADMIRTAPGSDASDERLWGFMLGYAPMFRQLFRHHILTTFQGVVGSGIVTDLCRDKLDDPGLALTLLGGIGDIESAGPARGMWALSRCASADYDRQFDDFIATYGFRGPNEWDIASTTWELSPELVTVAVDRMRTADDAHAPDAQAARMRRRADEAAEEARSKLNRVDRVLFDKALASLVLFSQGRERAKTTVVRSLHEARKAHRELARRAAERGGTDALADTCVLTPDEFEDYLREPAGYLAVIDERVALRDDLNGRVPPFTFEGTQPPVGQWSLRGDGAEHLGPGDTLDGIGGCPGTAVGRARVVRSPSDPGDLGPGDVLVAPITDPSWTPLFTVVEAVVVNVGAVMSHAIIVSRELGIPCVVSARDATERIVDGDLIEVDGTAGTVTILEAAQR